MRRTSARGIRATWERRQAAAGSDDATSQRTNTVAASTDPTVLVIAARVMLCPIGPTLAETVALADTAYDR